MRYTFTGKNISVYDDVKAKAEKKIDRMQKLLPDDAEVFVALSKNRHEYKMEVSVPMHKRLLRAEVKSEEIDNCLDMVVDVLEKQVKKYKGRLRERTRRGGTTPAEAVYSQEQPETADEPAINIQRTKRFAVKPMDPLDAVMEMELLGHSFFVFRSAETDEVNVVYKRNEGEYGLIEPQ